MKMLKTMKKTLSAFIVTGALVMSGGVFTNLPTASIAYAAEATVPVTLPKVEVIGTGGTIAGKSTNETSFTNYRAGTLLIEDMVKSLPNVDKMANVTTTQFGNKGSGGYTIPELFDLSLLVDEKLKTSDGVVVTTGTDTMEEIAYFLDLTVQSNKPVVVTGSMRPWTVIGSDAQANLFNAIKLAGSKKTSKFGTVVMLNDSIFSARDVSKSNSYRVDTFEANSGALGYIDGDNIKVYEAPARALVKDEKWKTPFDLKTISKDEIARVEIVYSYQNAGGEAIKAFADAGVKGIVTAGTGAGGISSAQGVERAAAIKNGVIFMSTTRTGSGNVYSSGNGIISGDNLHAQHARMFLMLSLSFSSDFDQIKAWASEYGAKEVEL